MAKNKKYLNDHDLLVAAFTAAQTNQHELAIKHFKEALRRDPRDPFALIEMGKSYYLNDQPARTGECLDKATKIAEQDASIYLLIANACQITRDYPRAISALSKAADRPELTAAAHTRQAEIFELANRLPEAKDALGKISDDSRSPAATAISAKLARREGDLEKAQQLLEALISQGDSDQGEFLASLHYELAAVHDKQGNHAAALAALKSAKSFHQGTDAYKISERGRRGAIGLLGELCSSLNSDQLQRWRDEATPLVKDDHQHSFLLGHPRSGTTLIEQTLDAHPEIQSADETGIFHNTVWMPSVFKHNKQRGTSFADFLNQLPSNFTRNLRNGYRQHWLQSQTDNSRNSKIWLDKNPALTTRLALIAKFFPEAPIIFALRDPRDVIISSFMQPVGVNDWSINWLTIEETVDYYCFAMQMWLDIREKLTNPWIEVRYENCVTDLAKESAQATRLLGLDWTDGQLELDQHVRGKTIYSPTYGDVAQPLYKSSVARWKHYEELLQPFENKLAPLIEQFGV